MSMGKQFLDDDDEENDQVPDLLGVPPPPKPKHKRMDRKRIRNASLLAAAGARGPQAAMKVEKEDDPTQVMDNELAVSFKSLQNLQTLHSQGPSPRCSASTSKKTEAWPGNEEPETKRDTDSVEQSVECEIGHRFDLVEPFILAGILADPEQRDEVLTVDVRGRDWVGGHIPSSINLRTSEVVSNPQTLLVKCRQNRVHHIVFTCMYSVLRARKCAQAVEKAQEEERKAGFAAYKVRISLLAGGMHAWVNHFIKDLDEPPKVYIDNFDAEMWSDGGPSQGGLVHVMDALWSSGGQKALSDALSQELEQLLLLGSRRSSQQSNSDKCGSTLTIVSEIAVTKHSPERAQSPEGLDSETAELAQQVAETLAQMRQSSPKLSGTVDPPKG
jgi:rhodanese-related sulfurtransferase